MPDSGRYSSAASVTQPLRVRAGSPSVNTRPHAKRRRGRLELIQNTAVAVAVLVLATVLIAHALRSSTVTLAVTPKPLAYHMPPLGAPSGRQELLKLAAAAARQPTGPAEHPRYAYAETRGWYLRTQIGGRTASSVVVPSTTESWLATNGSGREHTVSEEPDGSRSVDDFNPTSGPPILRLSTDVSVLKRQLALGHPASDGPVEQFVALTDLARQQPLSAPAESAILRLLARAPGLINSGGVIDREGRPGVAVSLDSAYAGPLTRYTWIFDRHTGKLLGDEETLIGNPGKLKVRKGSVLASTAYLASGWVTNTSSRPARTS